MHRLAQALDIRLIIRSASMPGMDAGCVLDPPFNAKGRLPQLFEYGSADPAKSVLRINTRQGDDKSWNPFQRKDFSLRCCGSSCAFLGAIFVKGSD